MRPAPNVPLPRPLSGFSHIDRYWDRTHKYPAAKILPGEFYASKEDEMVVTVLGSCIAACIRDPVAAIGGMNHFLLPNSKAVTRSDSEAARYGAFAMERLINVILKNGGEKDRLEVKIFGGGRILRTMTDIGAQNIAFVRDFLAKEGIAIAGENVGSTHPRKIYYFAQTGKVLLKKIEVLHNDTIERREREFFAELATKPVSGDAELF